MSQILCPSYSHIYKHICLSLVVPRLDSRGGCSNFFSFFQLFKRDKAARCTTSPSSSTFNFFLLYLFIDNLLCASFVLCLLYVCINLQYSSKSFNSLKLKNPYDMLKILIYIMFYLLFYDSSFVTCLKIRR